MKQFFFALTALSLLFACTPEANKPSGTDEPEGGKDKTVHVTGIQLNPTSTTIKEGESVTLVATVTPSNADNKTVSWSSSSDAVATVDASGKVTGVKVQEIDWKPNPDGGRPIMVEKGEPFIIKADLVLLAMGFLKPELPEYLERSAQRNASSSKASLKNVFVCGDAANGASLVVKAIASGLQTAARVNSFLESVGSK